MINKVDIVNAIVNIEDPDLNKTLAELNAIKEVTIEDNTVKVYIELVQPIFTIYEEISQKINEGDC